MFENNKKTLAQARTHYLEKRGQAYLQAVKFLKQSDPEVFSGLKISEITPSALNEFENEWDHASRRVQWNWRQLSANARRKSPSHWEAAVWSGSKLCGLILGRTSNARSRLYVQLIEAIPHNNPYKSKFYPLALSLSEMYAEGVGCEEVWLVEPIKQVAQVVEQAGYNRRPAFHMLTRALRGTTFIIKRTGSS